MVTFALIGVKFKMKKSAQPEKHPVSEIGSVTGAFCIVIIIKNWAHNMVNCFGSVKCNLYLLL